VVTVNNEINPATLAAAVERAKIPAESVNAQ